MKNQKALSYIHKIETLKPTYTQTQEDSIQWLARAYSIRGFGEYTNLLQKMSRFACKSQFIEKRGHESKEFLTQDPDEMKIFHPEKKSSIEERIQEASQAVAKSLQYFYSKNSEFFLQKPKTLLHVSCTVYESPSQPQRFWSSFENAPGIFHLYQMGCYAALPAQKIASHLTQTTDIVDVLHNEICTIHLNLDQVSAEQWVIQSLFADGHVLCRYAQNPHQKNPYFEVYGNHETLIPNSSNEMGWNLGSFGFQMSLGGKVPQLLSENILPALENACHSWGLNWNEIKDHIEFAIHPGGPKIIDLVEKTLNLNPSQVESSRRIMKNHGNMSSATLPHVWKDILENNKIQNQWVISTAFGPGLTLCFSLMKKINS